MGLAQPEPGPASTPPRLTVDGESADLDHLAAALAALLASWWRRRQAVEEMAAEDKSAAEEVRDAGARPSAEV